MNDRKFCLLGVQQIAIGGLSREPLQHLWSVLLGLEAIGEFTSEAENIKETRFQLGFGHNRVEVDIMEPIDPDKSPRVHVPALHHIGIWVDNLPEAVVFLEEQGVRFAAGGIRRGASGHDMIFIHPRPDEKSPLSGEGVLIELVQAPEELIRSYASGVLGNL